MGRTGVTAGGFAQTTGGVVFGTVATSGVALVSGATAGATHSAAVPIEAAIAVGANYGRLGTVIENRAGRITGFIREGAANPFHGLDQAISRGVTTSTMLNTVSNPSVTLQQAGGNTMYLTRQAAVILNQAGKVVTTYGSGQFQQHVSEVLKSVK